MAAVALDACGLGRILTLHAAVLAMRTVRRDQALARRVSAFLRILHRYLPCYDVVYDAIDQPSARKREQIDA